MDSAAFLITLGVAVAVIAWFILNEAKDGSGSLGLFAIKEDRAETEKIETARYRKRERLTPEPGERLRVPGMRKAYRPKKDNRAASFVDGQE